jgi:hypothetical protein
VRERRQAANAVLEPNGTPHPRSRVDAKPAMRKSEATCAREILPEDRRLLRRSIGSVLRQRGAPQT